MALADPKQKHDDPGDQQKREQSADQHKSADGENDENRTAKRLRKAHEVTPDS